MEPRSATPGSAQPVPPARSALTLGLTATPPRSKAEGSAIAAALRARREAQARQRQAAGSGPPDHARSRKSPRLRLVPAPDGLAGEDAGFSADRLVELHPDASAPAPITDVADPRWVLAVRTAERLEGSILRPEHREVLLALGKSLGLSPFDAALVLAIVQDQARRGHAPAHCPSAGEPQLRMVPPVRRRGLIPVWSAKRWLAVGIGLLLLTAAELFALRWFLGV